MFGIKFNKAPKQKKSYEVDEMGKESDEDKEEFWVALSEGEKQIIPIEKALDEGAEPQELKKITEKVAPLVWYLKKTEHFVPENLLHHEYYSRFVEEYDEQVLIIKNFRDTNQLRESLQKIHQVAHSPHAA